MGQRSAEAGLQHPAGWGAEGRGPACLLRGQTPVTWVLLVSFRALRGPCPCPAGSLGGNSANSRPQDLLRGTCLDKGLSVAQSSMKV